MTAINVHHEQISQIIVDVFDSMLGQTVLPLDHTGTGELPFEAVAQVNLSGAWNGSVVMRCCLEQARKWAAELTAVPDLAQDDMRDVLGELTNMIGGNIKALLPARTVLSVPSVSLLDELSKLHLPGEVDTAVHLDGPYGAFTVLLTGNRSK